MSVLTRGGKTERVPQGGADAPAATLSLNKRTAGVSASDRCHQ